MIGKFVMPDELIVSDTSLYRFLLEVLEQDVFDVDKKLLYRLGIPVQFNELFDVGILEEVGLAQKTTGIPKLRSFNQRIQVHTGFGTRQELMRQMQQVENGFTMDVVDVINTYYPYEVYLAEDLDGNVVYIGEGVEGRHDHLNSGVSGTYEANEYHFRYGELYVETYCVPNKFAARQLEKMLIRHYRPLWNIQHNQEDVDDCD